MLQRKISQTLFVLAFGLMLFHLAIYVHYAVGLIRFPFDYDQGEGFELVDTQLFSQGDWPYRNPEIYPFYASNYPPLFHVMLVPFAWVFGEEYWYGRLAGFVGTLITAAVIGSIVYREEHHRGMAILSGLAFLASNTIYHIGPLFRQHMTMVMFETLSVVVLAHVSEIPEKRRRRRVMIIGLLLLLAAGFTKQLALATAIAVFSFLFVRNPRRSLAWGMLFAAVTGLLFLWIDYATGGEWHKNIIAANVNTYYPSQFVGLFEQWFRLHGSLIVMAGLFALYELYFARLSLYTFWWVFAVADSVLSGKWGAGDSYFATAIAATCVLSGLFAARTLRGAWHFPTEHYLTRRFGPLRARLNIGISGTAVAGIIIPALYLVYGVSVVKMPTAGTVFGPLSHALGLESSYGDRYAFYDSAGWTPGYATLGQVPTQTDVNNGWQIVDRLRESPKPAMSEDAGFSIRAGKTVVSNPTQLKNLYENDLFDPTALVAAIRAQDFGTIVFRAQFYPPPVLDAVYNAYYPAKTIPMNGFSYELWEPGPPQAERDAVAATVDTLQLGDTREQDIALPFEAASLWVDHMLAQRGWESVFGDAPATNDSCRTQAYQRDKLVLHVELCPVENQSRLSFQTETK